MRSTVDISKWTRFNLESRGSDMRVRRGFRRVSVSFGAAPIEAYFTVRSDITDEVHHYIFYTASGTLYLRIYDELWTLFQSLTIGKSIPPAGSICKSEILGAVYFTAPNMDMVWGYVGGGCQIARVYENGSYDPDLTLLALPRGISVGWGARLVVSDGFGLYFSEPARPRAFNAANLVNPPGGAIHGLEVSTDGDLLISSTTGTWSLSRQAGEQGFFMAAVPFQKVSDARTVGYGQTAIGDGRLWVSHRDGIQLADVRREYVEPLADTVTRGRFDPVDVDDFRGSVVMYGDDEGAYVAMMDRDIFWHAGSWHTEIGLRGVGRDQYGRINVASHDGVYLWYGNYDENTPGALDTQIWGAAAGSIMMKPQDSMTIRNVEVQTDGLSASCTSGLNRSTDEKTADVKQLFGPIIGTDAWATTTKLRVPPVDSQQFRWADRSDEHQIEVGARGGQRRLGVKIDVTQEGLGRKRKS